MTPSLHPGGVLMLRSWDTKKRKMRGDEALLTDGRRFLGFILGLPRSGTTLLSAMLNNHPSVAVPAEPWIMLALESLGRTSIRHPANSQAIGSAVYDFLPEDMRRAALRAAAEAVYDGWRERLGKPVFIDKTPRYHLIVDFLADVFPDARFIVLLRDPFDIAASYRTTWNVDLPDLLRREADDPLSFDLPVGLARLHGFIKAHPDKTHVMRYEDLAADPATALAGALAHLGLPTDDAAALTRIDPGKQAEGRMGDRKILATARPHARSIGGGREIFDAPDRQILLDVVGAARMRALGYGATVDALSAGGTLDRGEDLAAHHLARMETLIAARRDDMMRESTLGVDLPASVQRRVHAALTGDAAWEAETGAALDAVRREMRDGVNLLADGLRRLETQTAPALSEKAAAAAEVVRLEERLAAAMQEIGDLRREAARRETRLHAVLASTSWKITAPLRALAAIFRS